MVCLLVAAALAAAAGCGDDSVGSGGSASSTNSAVGPGATSSTSPTAASGSAVTGATASVSSGSGGIAMSAGCGLADPPSGDTTLDVGGQPGSYRVSIPAAYDPTKPYPLGFAFHGSGRTGPDCQAGDCAGFQSVMQDDAVLVYMTSLGGPGWDDFDLNSTFFSGVLDHVLASYCIDPGRVFAAGTSSGAHFSNVVGCRFGDRLLAIAPVAGYLPQTEGCVDRVAALVIHGVYDSHVDFSSGEEARDFWRTRNNCSADTTPPIADVHAQVTATAESHGCAVYQGCDAGLGVTWCEHSEGGYDGSTHGWPQFGGQEIWDFVNAL